MHIKRTWLENSDQKRCIQTMHIAICDDNVADRKHLERLLSRESDKRAGTPNILYVDSYGEKMHFLANPLKYNLIFMDMSSRWSCTRTRSITRRFPIFRTMLSMPGNLMSRIHSQDFWRWGTRTSPDMSSRCRYISTPSSPIYPSIRSCMPLRMTTHAGCI